MGTVTVTHSSTVINENAKAAIAYILGFVTGIIVLFIAKGNKHVRFHAWQAIIGPTVIGGIVNFMLMTVFTGALLSTLLTIWLFVLVGYVWYGAFLVYTRKSFRIPVIAWLVDSYLVK
jgi:uncharacterized membrane protein